MRNRRPNPSRKRTGRNLARAAIAFLPNDPEARDAIRRCPFQMVLTPGGRPAPISAIYAVFGAALPLPDGVIAAVQDLFAQGRGLLLVAANDTERRLAEQAIVPAATPSAGRA